MRITWDLPLYNNNNNTNKLQQAMLAEMVNSGIIYEGHIFTGARIYFESQ